MEENRDFHEWCLCVDTIRTLKIELQNEVHNLFLLHMHPAQSKRLYCSFKLIFGSKCCSSIYCQTWKYISEVEISEVLLPYFERATTNLVIRPSMLAWMPSVIGWAAPTFDKRWLLHNFAPPNVPLCYQYVPFLASKVFGQKSISKKWHLVLQHTWGQTIQTKCFEKQCLWGMLFPYMEMI